ncbi:rubrerythrin [mine drainage metagenome]|uniref:Rubrerythrin n=1 Tax=mine drainage metagenome TaxID=410659 RepID=A0A1J5Q7K9_9ZZZZ
METVEAFLAHACKLEQDAALRFADLAEAARGFGNAEVEAFFRQMAQYSRAHYQEARARAGFRTLPGMEPDDFVWPGLESPESAAIWGADPLMDVRQALDLALAAEQAGYDFYRQVLDETRDPEIRTLAEAFVAEEAQHVRAVERWIARMDAAAQ